MVQEMGLIIAIKKYFLPDGKLEELRKEWNKLSDEDKKELVVLFNKNKPLGEEVVVVLKK